MPRFLMLIATAMGATSALRAQVNVQVSPVLATDPVARYANSTGNTVMFTVTNNGTFDTQYSRTCNHTGQRHFGHLYGARRRAHPG